MPYSVREALAGFRRSPLLLAISVVAVSLSLFVFGLFGLAAYNIRLALADIEARVEVVAYLHDDSTPEQVRRAEQEIRAMPDVLDVRFVSKSEALATAARELSEFRDVITGLETNPLPASFEIRLRPGSRTPEATERVAQHVLAYPFIEDAEFGREWLTKIVSLQRIAGGATFMIGGAFAAVAIIVIGTAVRIAVFARREEIEIMRLVGATDGFIRRPFLVEGLVAGLLGGVIAALLSFATYRVVTVTLMEIAWIPAVWLIATVAAGALYGLLASGVAVRRHLRPA